MPRTIFPPRRLRATPNAALRLITCGGAFERDRHYLAPRSFASLRTSPARRAAQGTGGHSVLDLLLRDVHSVRPPGITQYAITAPPPQSRLPPPISRPRVAGLWPIRHERPRDRVDPNRPAPIRPNHPPRISGVADSCSVVLASEFERDRPVPRRPCRGSRACSGPARRRTHPPPVRGRG